MSGKRHLYFVMGQIGQIGWWLPRFLRSMSNRSSSNKSLNKNEQINGHVTILSQPKYTHHREFYTFLRITFLDIISLLIQCHRNYNSDCTIVCDCIIHVLYDIIVPKKSLMHIFTYQQILLIIRFSFIQTQNKAKLIKK